MKKFVVLMMVLGLASLANAGLLYDADATAPYEITITYQDTADTTLDVYIDYTPLAVAGIDVTQATLTGTGAGIANLFVYTLGVEGADWLYLALASASTATFGAGTELGVLDLNGAAPNVGSTVVTLDLYNGEGVAAGTVDVMVVPEPATMVLLGLGGLLLRRKK